MIYGVEDVPPLAESIYETAIGSALKTAPGPTSTEMRRLAQEAIKAAQVFCNTYNQLHRATADTKRLRRSDVD